MSEWMDIDCHPLNDEECILAEFDAYGQLLFADRGGWVEGDINEEWDEVEDGVKVLLWSEQEDGHWWSNYEIIEEPTHYMTLEKI